MPDVWPPGPGLLPRPGQDRGLTPGESDSQLAWPQTFECRRHSFSFPVLLHVTSGVVLAVVRLETFILPTVCIYSFLHLFFLLGFVPQIWLGIMQHRNVHYYHIRCSFGRIQGFNKMGTERQEDHGKRRAVLYCTEVSWTLVLWAEREALYKCSLLSLYNWNL